MNLQDKILELKGERLVAENHLKSIDHKIEKYSKMSDVSNSVLLSSLAEIGIQKHYIDDVLDFTLFTGEYEHILGGDGRSRPWSETRTGMICEIEFKVYLSEDQHKLVLATVSSLFKYDKLKIVI